MAFRTVILAALAASAVAFAPAPMVRLGMLRLTRSSNSAFVA